MYKFTKIIYIFTLALVFLSPKISNALDEKVGLRCDETYAFDNKSLCFPADAIFKDGKCECPESGCKLCPTNQGGTRDYYCETPISTLANIRKKPPTIYVSRHYEEFLYRNSCGVKNRKSFDEETCLAWFVPIFAPVAATGPFGIIAAIASATSVCVSRYEADADDEGTEDIFTINPKFDSIYDKPSTPLTPAYPITKLFRSKFEENSSYAMSPRIERLIINNQEKDVLRLYFSQIHKTDAKQLLINLYSDSNNDNYFNIDELKHNDDNDNFWKSYTKWLPVELCEKISPNSDNSPKKYQENGIIYIRTDKGNSGINCYNSQYIANRLVDGNASDGLILPTQGTEPFFPDDMSLYKGGSFKIAEPPTINWKVSQKDSNFMNPVIEVSFTDNNGVEKNNKTIRITELSKIFYHKANDSFNYQLLMKVVNNTNFQKEKQICLYACQTHVSGSYCLKKGFFTNQKNNLDLKKYLFAEDKIMANRAKHIFQVKANNNKNCQNMPNIDQTNDIKISGLGINSTYENPKVSISINNQTTYIIGLNNDEDINKIMNFQNEEQFAYVKNNTKKNIFKPHIFNLAQDLKIKYHKSTNISCELKQKSCPENYSCLNEICYNIKTKETKGECPTISDSCQNGTKCVNGQCIKYENICDIYGNCNNLKKVNDKSLICVRNLSRNVLTGDDILSHPYNINNTIIQNDSKGYNNNNNNNLCIPAPQKISEITHNENSNDYKNPKSNITIKYLLPKATNNKITQISKVIENFVGAKQNTTKTIQKRFDYHNNLKFIFTNENGLYCTYVQKYDYKNKKWADQGLDKVTNLTKSGDKYKIGQCKNLNYCEQGDAGILQANFMKTKANSFNVKGSCTEGKKGTPIANCNKFGKWEIVSGECVKRSCPNIIVNKMYRLPHGSKNASFNVANTEEFKNTISTTKCRVAYTGNVTLNSQCGEDGKWSKHEISHNCVRTGCAAPFPYTRNYASGLTALSPDGYNGTYKGIHFGISSFCQIPVICNSAQNSYSLASTQVTQCKGFCLFNGYGYSTPTSPAGFYKIGERVTTYGSWGTKYQKICGDYGWTGWYW